MARIRILTAVSGTGFQWSPGQLVDMPGAQASAWADGVRAELVRDEPTETTVPAAGERAARTRRKAG